MERYSIVQQVVSLEPVIEVKPYSGPPPAREHDRICLPELAVMSKILDNTSNGTNGR
jgi:hypothetical protein